MLNRFFNRKTKRTERQEPSLDEDALEELGLCLELEDDEDLGDDDDFFHPAMLNENLSEEQLEKLVEKLKKEQKKKRKQPKLDPYSVDAVEITEDGNRKTPTITL